MLYRKIVYPLLFWQNGQSNILRYLRELEKSQWLTPEEIKDLQWNRLKRMLQHAYENVPYYNNLFKSLGAVPEDIRSPADFARLPILAKEDVQDNLNDLLAKNYENDLIPNATGGSTGKPLNFFRNRESELNNYAATFRHFQMTGWQLGDKMALLWAYDKDLSADSSIGKRIALKYLWHRCELNAFDLNEEKLHDFTIVITKFKSAYLRGIATALYLFARYVRENGYSIKLDGIISEAEVLHPFQRELIEQTFQTKVFDVYGCREFGPIASECSEHEGMHINAENLYVEFIRDNQPVAPGEDGDIIITSLRNFGLPFIRYKIEDTGEPSNAKCPCGRGLPMIKAVTGRTSDFFVTQDGRLVHGEYFTHLFWETRGVKQFQIVQKDYNEFTLRIVKSEEFDSQEIHGIVQRMREHIGENLNVTVEYLSRIPPTASGKYHFAISEIRQNRGGAENGN